MKRSFFLKIFAGYLLGFIALAAFLTIVAFSSIRNFYIQQLTADLSDLVFTLNRSISPKIGKPDLAAGVMELGRTLHRRFTIIMPDGTVTADSESDPATMLNHATRTEVADILNRHKSNGSAIRYSSTLHRSMLYVAVPIMEGGKLIAVTRVSVFLTDIDEHLATLQRHILFITATLIFIALIAAYVFSRRLSRPVQQLAEAARRVSEGNFTTRTYLARHDEFKGLADAFNDMTERIHTLFSALTRQREELGKIVASINEALFVLSADGKVTLGNDRFSRLVRSGAIEGKYHWELFRSPPFAELLARISATGESVTEEIEHEGKVLLCSVASLGAAGEHIVVLHDITQIRDMERMKRDLVANVSHELRTPLTAIKGFVETLEEEAGTSEPFQRYLAIIARHTDRLIHIVEDLLLLSELENRDGSMAFADTELNGILETTSRIFEQKAAAKGLALVLARSPEPLTVRGDAFKLEQLFVNLIDNAIKYTEHGRIDIRLTAQAAHAEITIADTGIGISAQHLPHIFERFYVADKSRSKKLGGTGLGLSIVKHIVTIHNGTISIESVPGTGTTVHIAIPRT